MFGKTAKRKLILLCSILPASVTLLLSSATVASAWTSNKHSYHFKMHQNLRPKSTSAFVAGRAQNDGSPWYPPGVQSASTSRFPKRTTWTAGSTRYVRFYGPTVPYCRRCWFHTEFHLRPGPLPSVSMARFSWNGGPWISLGSKTSSDPVFFNPLTDPDCNLSETIYIRNIQLANSETRIPSEETTTDNPVVQNLYWDPVRVGPFPIPPGGE
jgi:hypothetical protein